MSQAGRDALTPRVAVTPLGQASSRVDAPGSHARASARECARMTNKVGPFEEAHPKTGF